MSMCFRHFYMVYICHMQPQNEHIEEYQKRHGKRPGFYEKMCVYIAFKALHMSND